MPLLTQIDELAGDSSDNGVNLLAGNNLTVNFNEDGTSALTIGGVNFNVERTWTVSDQRQRFPGQHQHCDHGNRDQQLCDHLRSCPDADLRHQFVDDLDSADV